MNSKWWQKIAGAVPIPRGRSGGVGGQVAVYVSGSAVAMAHLSKVPAPGDDSPLDVHLRADSIKQLSEVGTVLDTQAASLGIHNARALQQCNLVLAPEMYQLTMIERPDLPEEDIRDAVRWMVQEQVDFSMDDAVLDVFDLPQSASRDRRMIFVVSMQRHLLRPIVEQCHASGLKLASVDVSELAARNLLWQCYPQADHNVAMLRLTSNSGLICVSRADELYLARRISGMPGEFSEAAWDQFRDRLLLQVQRSIDYYESAMNQPHCDLLVVACTDAWSARVTEHLSEMLPIPVRSVSEVLSQEVQLTLHNPEPMSVDWARMQVAETNAVAAGLPAIGGVLRGRIAAAVAEVA